MDTCGCSGSQEETGSAESPEERVLGRSFRSHHGQAGEAGVTPDIPAHILYTHTHTQLVMLLQRFYSLQESEDTGWVAAGPSCSSSPAGRASRCWCSTDPQCRASAGRPPAPRSGGRLLRGLHPAPVVPLPGRQCQGRPEHQQHKSKDTQDSPVRSRRTAPCLPQAFSHLAPC